MDHQVPEALERTVTVPGVAAEVQVLQGVEGEEGLVTHALEQVVRQVDLLHVARGEVLEGNTVDLDQLVGAQVDFAKIAKRRKLVSSQPGWILKLGWTVMMRIVFIFHPWTQIFRQQRHQGRGFKE